MQKLSRTIAVIGLLAPLGASALGVGDIRLHSALNQSLNAEIPLVLSGPENISDVKIALAGPEAFAKAGVERQYFLTKLHFEAIRKPDGSHAIEVRSRDVMREPFLTFLVEVNWPQGRILREFTVLMDPPATLPDAGFAETEPAFVARPTRRYERVAAPDVAEEVPPVRRRPSRRSVSPEQQAENRAALGAPPAADQLTGENYGPVQRNENLWSIAKPLAQDAAVSHEQMAIALFRANPQAFGGDINHLRAGATLRIPTKDYINQFGAQQARSAFARQQGGMGGGLAVAGPENQLKLLSPTDAKARAEGAAATREGKAKGELALEVAETVKQENEEFRSRLRDLEQKLGELQRLIVLKDQQISSLQTQPRTSEQPPAETRPQLPTPAEPVVKAEPQQPSAAQPAPSPQQPPSMPPPAQARTEPPAAQPAVPKPPAPKPVPAPRPAVTPPPAEEPGFSIEPAYLGAAGAIAGVGLLAWLIRRSRNMKIAETESILLAAERESLQKARLSTSKSGETPLEPVVSPKSSFLSEFTPSDFDALGSESDEVDPIAEADVYLAYGRYKQAEDLIRHAIAQHPDRDECKLKLLEIYSATENRPAFEEYAKSLKQTYKVAKPEFWAKIEDMARDLPPGGDLFQVSEPSVQKPKAQASGTAKKAGGMDLSDDLIDDLKRFEIEFAEPAAGEDEEDLFAQFAPAPDEKTEPGPTSGSAAAGAKKPVAGESERGVSDNLIAFGRSTPQRPEPAPPKRTEKSIDDILRELTANLSDETPAEPDVQPPEAAAGTDDIYRTIEFEGGLSKTKTRNEPSLEVEVPEVSEDIAAGLTDMDQFETKLDLAKAYVDMEDDESAREILQDIVANGNEKQKSEARALMEKIGSAGSELFAPESRAGRV